MSGMTSAGVLVEVCYDARLLMECHEVLHRRPRFGFDPFHVELLLGQIRADGVPVAAIPLTRHLRDPDDDMFLEVALAGHAAYLITKNLADYPTHSHQPVPIVSPSQCLEQYRSRASHAQWLTTSVNLIEFV